MNTGWTPGGTSTFSQEVHWTRHRIIAALQAWATEHDRTPMRTDWDPADKDGKYPSAATVTSRFGTWNKALTAARLPLNAPGPDRPTMDEKILLSLRIPVALHAAIERIAVENEEPMTSVVRRALKREVERNA